jgi:hypothetical protein
MHQLQIAVGVERHWTPCQARQHDVILMVEFLKNNFTPSQLFLINSCQLYLQVILLSDITSADGRHILPSMFQGSRAAHMTSTLQWPRQDTPLDPAWSLRRLVLEYFSANRNLHTSLGSWLTIPIKIGNGSLAHPLKLYTCRMKPTPGLLICR